MSTIYISESCKRVSVFYFLNVCYWLIMVELINTNKIEYTNIIKKVCAWKSTKNVRSKDRSNIEDQSTPPHSHYRRIFSLIWCNYDTIVTGNNHPLVAGINRIIIVIITLYKSPERQYKSVLWQRSCLQVPSPALELVPRQRTLLDYHS